MGQPGLSQRIPDTSWPVLWNVRRKPEAGTVRSLQILDSKLFVCFAFFAYSAVFSSIAKQSNSFVFILHTVLHWIQLLHTLHHLTLFHFTKIYSTLGLPG